METINVFYIVVLVFLLAVILSCWVSVNQGYIYVVTMFGKYRRILRPGLNFKVPFLEQVYKKISIQNRSVELEFQAVTADQANVYFKSMLLYAVQNAEEETIQRVAFKFISDRDLMQALTRTIEGSIRSFVATKKQAEILGLRKDIVEFVKDQIDQSLEAWGYHLMDLQINDITFDKAILESMSKVVASNNLKAAAENEGQALLITKTKAAEAEGNAIKISAGAEREAAQAAGSGGGAFPSGSGAWDERSRRGNEEGQPGYQCDPVQHVDGSDQEFRGGWEGKYHFPGWEQPGDGEYDAADPVADGEAVRDEISVAADIVLHAEL